MPNVRRAAGDRRQSSAYGPVLQMLVCRWRQDAPQGHGPIVTEWMRGPTLTREPVSRQDRQLGLFEEQFQWVETCNACDAVGPVDQVMGYCETCYAETTGQASWLDR